MYSCQCCGFQHNVQEVVNDHYQNMHLKPNAPANTSNKGIVISQEKLRSIVQSMKQQHLYQQVASTSQNSFKLIDPSPHSASSCLEYEDDEDEIDIFENSPVQLPTLNSPTKRLGVTRVTYKKWDRKETSLFINLMEKYIDDFDLKGNMKNSIYDNISEDLSSMSNNIYKRSASQLETKWRSLKSSYKAHKDSKGPNYTGTSPTKEPEFFNMLDSFLYKRADIAPPAVCSSANGLKVAGGRRTDIGNASSIRAATPAAVGAAPATVGAAPATIGAAPAPVVAAPATVGTAPAVLGAVPAEPTAIHDEQVEQGEPLDGVTPAVKCPGRRSRGKDDQGERRSKMTVSSDRKRKLELEERKLELSEKRSKQTEEFRKGFFNCFEQLLKKFPNNE